MTVPMQRSIEERPAVQSVINAVNKAEWSPAHALSIHRQGAPPVRLPLFDLQLRVVNVASWLLDLGLQRHDRIGILSRNRLEWILLDLAALRLGIVTAGFEPEPFAKRSNLVHIYGLHTLFHDCDCDAARGAGGRAISMVAVMAASIASNGPQRQSEPIEYGPGDVCTIKFTSGSTGDAKALAATIGSIDQSLNAAQAMFEHSHGDRLLIFLPLSLLQQRYWIYSALAFGHDVVVATPALALETLRIEHPTVVMGVPAFFEMLKQFIESIADGGPLRAAALTVLGPNVRYMWTGSAPARRDVLAFFDETCGVPLFEGYGMNETCIVSKNHPGAHRRGSVGKPIDGVEVSIDPDGIIRVHRRYPVNTAYLYALPGASERIFGPDGSVTTGDLGHLDSDGYLYVLGRADDLVVLENGHNVAVRLLEETISQDPSVCQVMILGTGRSALAAIVYPAEGADLAAVRDVVQRAGTPDDGEAVRVVVLAREPFTAENNLLTSQAKLRRAAIASSYATEIDEAYGETR